MTFQVIFGGGRDQLTPTDTADPEDGTQFGLRQDNRNIINEWLGLGGRRSYVWNKEQFDQLNVDSTDHMIGDFGTIE